MTARAIRYKQSGEAGLCRLARASDAKALHGASRGALDANHSVKITGAGLFQRGGARLLGEHLELGRGDDRGLPLDVDRVPDRAEIGSHQIGDAPAACRVRLDTGQWIIRPPCALLLRQVGTNRTKG